MISVKKLKKYTKMITSCSIRLDQAGRGKEEKKKRERRPGQGTACFGGVRARDGLLEHGEKKFSEVRPLSL